MSTAHFGRAVPLGLRRFTRLPCAVHSAMTPPAEVVAGSATTAAAPRTMVLPQSLPPGVHVVLLMNRRRQIEHCDSWLSVREAWDRVLADRGLRQEGEMQMYICCLLPKFWPLRWIWRWRIRQWQELLAEEDHPSVHLLSTTAWTSGFHDTLQIPNDGRAYAMVIRNDGEILWASDDAFKEHLQEKAMVRVVNQECEYRVDEQQKLLQSSVAGGELEEGAESTPARARAGPEPGEAPPSSPSSGPSDPAAGRGAAAEGKDADRTGTAASRGAAAGGA